MSKQDNQDIIKTADGRITFRRSDFKSMKTAPESPLFGRPEIVIWTTPNGAWAGGQIFKYSSFAEANQVAKEIQEQL